MKFSKGDKAKVVNTGDVWEDKIVTVISEGEEIITKDDKDLTEVEVFVDIDTMEGTKQQVRATILRSNLKKVSDENLNEVINEAKEDEKLPQFKTAKEFRKFFIGKVCIFKGFNYSDIYEVRELEDGLFDYKEEDKEEIEIYKAHEGKSCTILACAIDNGWEETRDTKECFDDSFWDIKFEDETEFYAIRGSCLELKANQE